MAPGRPRRRDLTLPGPGEEPFRLPSGLLEWQVGDAEATADAYRVTRRGERDWECSFRGRRLSSHPRRVSAFAYAEHHHRELRRRRIIIGWSIVAAVSGVIAGVALAAIETLWGVWVLGLAFAGGLSALARVSAAAGRSLDDPYRAREPWEEATWWNR